MDSQTYIVILIVSVATGVQALPEQCSQPQQASYFCPGGHVAVNYFYNTTSDDCEAFLYRGCGGNANRFNDRAKCLHTCTQRSICPPPPSPSPPPPGCHWRNIYDENKCIRGLEPVCEEPCIMPDMMPPPPDCHYDMKFDERGCYLNHTLVCDSTPWPCVVPDMAPPPPGCKYDIVYDSDDCYKSHSLDCSNATTPEPCMMPMMIPPREGCRYDLEYDDAGCYKDHKLVCDDCPSPPELLPAPTDCSYSFRYDDNGCYVDHAMRCARDTSNQCPPNEHFDECDTPCPETCEGKAEMCIEMCVSRCRCNDGYVRIINGGPCVRREDCPANQQVPPITCASVLCIRGTTCEIINGRPECVASDQCGVHEEYTECGSACPRTCQNRNESIACIAVCVPGCFCKSGYVRDGNTGECVQETQCPGNKQSCGANEQWSTCVPRSSCEPACDMGFGKEVCAGMPCHSGCACAPGFIRERAGGPCIPRNSCPKNITMRCNSDEDCSPQEECSNKHIVCVMAPCLGHCERRKKSTYGTCQIDADCNHAAMECVSANRRSGVCQLKRNLCVSQSDCEENEFCTNALMGACAPSAPHPCPVGHCRPNRVPEQTPSTPLSLRCNVDSDCPAGFVCPPMPVCRVPDCSSQCIRLPNDNPCSTMRCGRNQRCAVIRNRAICVDANSPLVRPIG